MLRYRWRSSRTPTRQAGGGSCATADPARFARATHRVVRAALAADERSTAALATELEATELASAGPPLRESGARPAPPPSAPSKPGGAAPPNRLDAAPAYTANGRAPRTTDSTAGGATDSASTSHASTTMARRCRR